MDLDALFRLHRDLPREGPGSDGATAEAIRRLKRQWNPVDRLRFAGGPRVLDVGCGPGRQTLVLAATFQTPVVAIDFHEPYLEQLRNSAEAAGLRRWVTTCRAGMESLSYTPGSVDLIWAEGSIYIIGFATGLSLWRPLLREGGFVVASELTWFTAQPPAEAKAFWAQGYPQMTDVAGNIKHAAAVGFEVFDHFTLPQSAWWDEYLTPLSERIARLRVDGADGELLQVIEEQEQETDIVRRYGDHFGYVFYLMRKTIMPDKQECAHA